MPGEKKKKLRSGYTTGACAAAAAKAAVLGLMTGDKPDRVDIALPDGSRHFFDIHSYALHGQTAQASTIKDAGDDPDVTNGAEIGVTAKIIPPNQSNTDEPEITLRGGIGVGTVTKPGLAVPVGEPAINPVPRKMIRQAALEALRASPAPANIALELTVFIENGEQLAEKTLNHRLGIVGGLSILGTTGIVRPVSAKAWTDTIEASMQVAAAAGLKEIMLSTGRTSEAAVAKLLNMPDEGLVMMGDYLQYGLQAAARHGFAHIHLAGMWAKIVKAALRIPQTHVRNGALDVRDAAGLLKRLGLDPERSEQMSYANTAREIYQLLRQAGDHDLIKAVCAKAREYAEQCSGLRVTVYLVTSEEGVVEKI